MKNIQGWAVAAVMVVVAGCTTEATTDSDGGATSAASGGSAGAAGSTTTSSGAGGSATGGSGGSSSDGGACVAESSAGACEKCAFDKCMVAACECKAITRCSDGMDGYFMCVAGLEGGDMGHCAEDFAGSSGPGAGKADALAQCMETNCLDRCQGRDGG